MADNVQLPQDILKIELQFNPDLLRKQLTDMLIRLNEIEQRLDALEAE